MSESLVEPPRDQTTRVRAENEAAAEDQSAGEKSSLKPIDISIIEVPTVKNDSNGSFLPLNGDFLDCLLLSVWDNVVGPEAVFTWKRQDISSADKEKLEIGIKYAVTHTLHGELGKNNLSSLRRARGHELYVVEDAGLVIYSVPFSASRGRMTLLANRYHYHEKSSPPLPHSLALILSGFHLQRFKDLQPMIHLYMQRFACCVRAYLHKGDYGIAVAQLTPLVQQFCNNLASLNRPSNYLNAIQEVKKKKWDEMLPVLNLAITSHLQTCGCTVVIGDSIQEINAVIKVLSQFLQQKERSRVRFASPYDSPPYHPGILIQGMIKSINGEVNILTEDILRNVLPTTIVDLTMEQVSRSWLLHEHVRQRQIQFKKELIALFCDQKQSSAFTENVFQKVTEASPLVTEFIHKVWILENDPIQKRNQIQLFCRQLEYHALALIKLVNASYNCEPSSADCPRQVDKKKIMKKFNLMEESDFLVVLAVAEKLQQGIYHTLMSVDY